MWFEKNWKKVKPPSVDAASPTDVDEDNAVATTNDPSNEIAEKKKRKKVGFRDRKVVCLSCQR